MTFYLQEERVANKGSLSFVAMMVINPIVILFYQNFAMTPMSYAAKPTAPTEVRREVASVAPEEMLSQNEESFKCNGQREFCPQPGE